MRTKNIRCLIPRLLAGAFLILGVSSAQPVAPVGTPYVYKTVDGRGLKLFVLGPENLPANARRPAIVFFHGGGWTGGTASQFNHQSLYLVSRGMVAVQVEYRLLNRQSDDPPTVCVRDAKSAMRWVRVHAKELSVDPNRIASAGGSAGGHVAAFVGMMKGMDDPRDNLTISAKSNAMVLFNPVFDNGPSGWGYKRVGSRYKEFSPFHNVNSAAPPAIVLSGSDDKLIPATTVLRFQEAMRRAGVLCDVKIYEGQGHGFFNFRKSGNKYYSETMEAVDEFFTSLGWLKRQPSH